MNKTERVKNYLENTGHINSLEAIQMFGATRLSSIIYNLRYKYNMNIRSEKKEFTDRFGDKSYFVDYILEDNNE